MLWTMWRPAPPCSKSPGTISIRSKAESDSAYPSFGTIAIAPASPIPPWSCHWPTTATPSPTSSASPTPLQNVDPARFRSEWYRRRSAKRLRLILRRVLHDFRARQLDLVGRTHHHEREHGLVEQALGGAFRVVDGDGGDLLLPARHVVDAEPFGLQAAQQLGGLHGVGEIARVVAEQVGLGVVQLLLRRTFGRHAPPFRAHDLDRLRHLARIGLELAGDQ